MKSLSKSLIYGTIIVGSGGGIWKAYDMFFPKTAEDWFNFYGMKKVSSTTRARTIFAEHKEEIKKEIAEIKDNTEESVAAQKIKEYCETELKKPLVKEKGEKIVQFCEFKFETSKGFIASQDDKDFISKDEDYKVSAFLLKHISEDYENGKTKIKESGDATYSELKSGCEKELAKDLHKDRNIYLVANTFCKIQKPDLKTVENLIRISEGYSDGEIVTESDTSKGADRFETWKSTPQVITYLTENGQNSGTTSTTEKSQGGPKLKDGCKNGKDKPLDIEITNEFIRHIRDVCTSKDTTAVTTSEITK